MFPLARTPSRTARRSLRSTVVRGLDVAVELVTLGEYGVEEVAVVDRRGSGAVADLEWAWPARTETAIPGEAAPAASLPPVEGFPAGLEGGRRVPARLRPPGESCDARAARGRSRTRGGPAACERDARDS
jgi:hypothetical protein